MRCSEPKLASRRTQNLNVPRDRRLSLEEAAGVAYSAIAYLGLRHETSDREIGPYRRSDCSIHDAESGHAIVRGSGKGRGASATTGAVFEALEALSLGKDHFAATTILAPAHALLDQAITRDERLTASIAALDNNAMSFRRYESLYGNASLLYPTFYATPFYDRYAFERGDDYFYNPLLRYSSSTGVSSGSCRDEIVLHSIYELIERDAFGMFLLDLCFVRDARFRSVNIDTLPTETIKRVRDLEHAIASRILILDLTVPDIGIPVFCAVNVDDWSNGVFPIIKGFGCSANKAYALERSVAELAQFVAVCLDEPITTRDFYRKLLRDEPRYVNHCVNLPLAHISRQQTLVEYDTVFDYEADGTLPEQRAFIVEFLGRKGFPAFFSANAAFGTSVQVGHVFIPKLEKFYMNAFGGLVLPSVRRADMAKLIA